MKVLFFVSSKGGCGKSFLVNKISECYSEKCKVLVTEFSSEGRYMDLLYDITDSVLYDIADYSLGECSFKECITSINDNLDVICSPLSKKEFDFTCGFKKLMRDADDKYDCLMVDLCDRRYIDYIKNSGIEYEIIFVTDSSPLSLRNSESLLSRIGDEVKTSLIINRVNPFRIEKGYDKGVDEILDVLRIPLTGVVYELEGGFDNRMNCIRKSEESLLKTIIDCIVRRLDGEMIPVTEFKNGIINKLFG